MKPLKKKKKTPNFYELFNEDQAANLGRSYEIAKKERWLNPFIGRKAKAFLWGWNKSHGECKKCDHCLVGTPAITVGRESYVDKMQQQDRFSLVYKR
jgi:hypothetical protein